MTGFSELLQKAGINQTQVAEKMRSSGSIAATMEFLRDGLRRAGATASETDAILSRAFGGIRSGTGVIALFNNLQVSARRKTWPRPGLGGGLAKKDRKRAKVLAEPVGPMFKIALAVVVLLTLLSWVGAVWVVSLTGRDVASQRVLVDTFSTTWKMGFGAIAGLVGGKLLK